MAPPPASEPASGQAALRSILEATADKAGAEFLRHLVKHLALVTGAPHAFVAEFAGTPERVRTIAFWSNGDWGPNVEYDLHGTPCRDVLRDGICLCLDDVQRRFPDDADLRTLGARSYRGVALPGPDGTPLGHLAVIDTRPASDDPESTALLRLFADRARIEMERIRAEHLLAAALHELRGQVHHKTEALADATRELELARHELEALLRVNQAAGQHLDRDELFKALAGALRGLLPTDRFGIELALEGNMLQPHILVPRGAMGEALPAETLPAAGTACHWVEQHREWIVAASREEMRERFPVTHSVMSRPDVAMESLLAMPLVMHDRCRGVLFFMAAHRGAYTTLRRGLLEQVTSAVAVALDDCLAHEEVRRLRDQLAAENVYLQEEIRQEHHFGEIVGQSPALTRVLGLVESVAPTTTTVLVLGETGTGKELVARAVHERSARRDRPLVKVNCSAISAGLVESELFGHVKGAFTGAVGARMGRFELADGGTIFLDEIGELPLETQAKLLRILQEREFEPVGSSQSRRVDVRVIAATNRDLEAEVAAGRFRADLYFRLNVLPIRVPSLRERPEDVPLLAQFFVERFAREMGKHIDGIAADTMERLVAYDWPGNIRELQNVIERAVVLATGRVLALDPSLLGARSAPAAAPVLPVASAAHAGNGASASLADVEAQHLRSTLERCNWVIEGARGAAQALGLHPNTLRSRMKKLGIARPPAPSAG